VVIAGKRLVLVCATSQFDLVMSSLAMFTGRLLSRAICTARESGRTGASPEGSSPSNNIPAINAVPAIARPSCFVYFARIIFASSSFKHPEAGWPLLKGDLGHTRSNKHGPMEDRRGRKGTGEAIVVNDRSRSVVRSREEFYDHASRRGVVVVKGSLRDQRGLPQMEGNMCCPAEQDRKAIALWIFGKIFIGNRSMLFEPGSR
jgi:hypothetical protein